MSDPGIAMLAADRLSATWMCHVNISAHNTFMVLSSSFLNRITKPSGSPLLSEVARCSNQKFIKDESIQN